MLFGFSGVVFNENRQRRGHWHGDNDAQNAQELVPHQHGHDDDEWRETYRFVHDERDQYVPFHLLDHDVRDENP